MYTEFYKFINTLKPQLNAEGFFYFNSYINEPDAYFIKPLFGLYLSLGINMCKENNNHINLTYYFSTTTRWDLIRSELPDLCYRCISSLLTQEEITELNHKGYFDITSINVLNEIDFVLRVTEDRQANQPKLIKEIMQNEALKEISFFANKTIEFISSRFFFTKYINKCGNYNNEIGIPKLFIAAAKDTIKKHNGSENNKLIKLLALDAFRQYSLRNYNRL